APGRSVAAQRLERPLQVLGVLRGVGDLVSRRGMDEGQLHGVQPLADQAHALGEGGVRAVERVPDQRMVQGGHVHADLVRAARLQTDLQQGRALESLEGLVVGDRVLAVVAHRELVVVLRGAADGRLDRAARLLAGALADRVVDLAHLPGAEGVLEGGVGALGAGDDHQPGRAHVEAADDALSLRVAAGADLHPRGGEVPQHRRPAPSGAGVRGHADGLVDHHDVVVLVDQAHALGDLRAHLDGRLLVRQLDVHHHPGLQAGGAGGGAAVHEHVPGGHEIGGAGAGQAQHARDADVHALAREPVRHHQQAGGAHRSPSEVRCSAEVPPGGCSPSAGALCGASSVASDAASSAAGSVPGWASSAAGSAATPNSPRATMRIAPPTTPMSATLKTGQCGSSRKSTTAPGKAEGERSSRSWVLPSAPPMIRPGATAYLDDRTSWPATKTAASTVAICRPATAGVISEPIPHAAPVLYSIVSCSTSPRKGCGSSSSRFATAQFLVTWSMTASTAAIPSMSTIT